jgi:hypothetical protein
MSRLKSNFRANNFRQAMTPLDAMPRLATGGKVDEPVIVDRGLVLDLDRLAGSEPKVLVPGAPLDPSTMMGHGNHTPG